MDGYQLNSRGYYGLDSVKKITLGTSQFFNATITYDIVAK